MGSSSSKNCRLSEKSRRVKPTLSFIWNANFNSFESFFEVVPKENIRLGDVILFRIATCPQFSSWKHAGVYYGDKKVVHFDGDVYIQGINAMERTRGKYQVVRLKQGINKDALLKKIDVVLNAKTTYDCFTNNCIHFALSILDMEEFYHEIVSDVEVGNGNDDGEQVPLNTTGQADQNECNRVTISQREIPLRNFSKGLLEKK